MRMIKALLILAGLLGIGLGVLHERQRSLVLLNENARVHRAIEQAQPTFWRQQVQIAQFTSPKAIPPAPFEPSRASDRDVANARE